MPAGLDLQGALNLVFSTADARGVGLLTINNPTHSTQGPQSSGDLDPNGTANKAIEKQGSTWMLRCVVVG